MTKAEQALVDHMVRYSDSLRTYAIDWEGSDVLANKFRKDMEDAHADLVNAILLERVDMEIYALVLSAWSKHQEAKITARVLDLEERTKSREAAWLEWSGACDALEARFGIESVKCAKALLWARSEYPKIPPRDQAGVST